MALSPLAATNPNYAFAAQLLRDLTDAGVVHVVVCAGSRSAPLAATAATTPGLHISTHVDERSAAFFGLGLARAARAPVALVCTSGTAAVNFAPAVAEADRAAIPLIVLTADRPAELRDRGAPQTIDQTHLFGTHVRWFHESPPPDETPQPERLARSLAERATHEASGLRPGPVHLNLPFREPLDPSGTRSVSSRVPTLLRREPPTHRAGASGLAALGEALAGAARPLLVAGPLDPIDSEALEIAGWARRMGLPLLAEPLSGLRSGAASELAPLIASADALLRCESFGARMCPDLVICLGAPATSKALHRWFAAQTGRVVAFDPEGMRRDPDLRVDQWVDAAPVSLASLTSVASAHRDPGWLPAWLDADKRAWDAIHSVDSEQAPGLQPPSVLGAVARGIEPGSIVYLSNSLAVRDAESFLPPFSKPVRFLGNRGANGIDGMLSSALGAAETGRPVVLLTGDLALLHDAGAWFTARRRSLPLTVVAMNDGGGGIFDHLPIADRGEAVRFEDVFRLAHDQALAPIAEAYGCPAIVATSVTEVEHAVARATGPNLVEVRFDPATNLALHRQTWNAVARALAASA